MGKNKFTQSLSRGYASALLSEQQGQSGREAGMTLVEVMITMGVASTMMLGVLQLITYANKAGKNVAVTSDWGSLVNSVQLAINNDKNCKKMFLGMSFVGAEKISGVGTGSGQASNSNVNAGKNSISPAFNQTAAGIGVVGSRGLQLPVFNSKGVLSNIPVAIPGKYSNFSLDEIKIKQTQDRQEIRMTVIPDNGSYGEPGPSIDAIFYIYPVELSLSGTKVALTQTVMVSGSPSPGGNASPSATPSTKVVSNLTLGSQTLTTKQSISFNLVVGPVKDAQTNSTLTTNYTYNDNDAPGVNLGVGPDIVYSCYGIQMASAQSCRDMGGTYDGNRPEGQKCNIKPFNLTDNSYGPPGRNGLLQNKNGTRLTLNDAAPKDSPTDFSMGIDLYDPKYYKLDEPSKPESFWFHLGGGTSRTEFSWNYSPPKLDTESSGWSLSPPADMVLMRLKTKVVDPDPTTKSYVTSPSKQIRNLELTIGPDLDARDNASDANWKSVNKWYSTLAFGGKPTTKESDPANDNKYYSDTKIRSARANDLPNKGGLDFITENKERIQIDSKGRVAIRNSDMADIATLFFGPATDPTLIDSSTWIKTKSTGTAPADMGFEIGVNQVSSLQIGRTGETAIMPNSGSTVVTPSCTQQYEATFCTKAGPDGSQVIYQCGQKPSGQNCLGTTSTTYVDAVLRWGALSNGEWISSRQVGGAGVNTKDNQYGLDFYTQFTKRMSIQNDGKVVIFGDLEVKGKLINENTKSIPCGWYGKGCGKTQACSFSCPADRQYAHSMSARCTNNAATEWMIASTIPTTGGLGNTGGTVVNKGQIVNGFQVICESNGVGTGYDGLNSAMYLFCCSNPTEGYQ